MVHILPTSVHQTFLNLGVFTWFLILFFFIFYFPEHKFFQGLSFYSHNISTFFSQTKPQCQPRFREWGNQLLLLVEKAANKFVVLFNLLWVNSITRWNESYERVWLHSKSVKFFLPKYHHYVGKQLLLPSFFSILVAGVLMRKSSWASVGCLGLCTPHFLSASYI